EHGVNVTTAAIISGNTPIVRRYASGIYGLVGEHVPPGLVEQISASPLRRRKSLLFAGWHEGRIRLAYRLTAGAVRNGVISVPMSLAPFMIDDSALFDVDGMRVGTLSSNGKGAVWGLSPFFRRRGVEGGDVLEVLVDPTSQTSAIRVMADEDE
ncbi:MAG TPA: hypothetical protein VIK32_13575, partial [Candidatus Limnocylindrales bacterium]